MNKQSDSKLIRLSEKVEQLAEEVKAKTEQDKKKDKLLRQSLLLLFIATFYVCISILFLWPVVFHSNPLVYFTPIFYILALYQKAGAAGQLAFIQVPLFTGIGFLLPRWVSRRK